MTANRNKDTDILATARVLRLTGQAQMLALDTVPNWLGHREKAAELDKALIIGATKSQHQAIGRTVSNHLSHLRVVHGLTIVEENGVSRITG